MAITRQQNTLKVINPFIGILLILQAGSGIFHDLLPYEVFSTFHGLTGFVLTASVIVHIILNWNWFKTAFRKRKTPST